MTKFIQKFSSKDEMCFGLRRVRWKFRFRGPAAVIILAVRPVSYTHTNRWGRIISKDMHPMESASNIYKVNLVKKECVLPPRCVRTAKIPPSKLAF